MITFPPHLSGVLLLLLILLLFYDIIIIFIGVAARAAEERKHENSDEVCSELGWQCIPIVIEMYGSWGAEARQTLSQLAS